jgi:hypothetical protein
VTAPAPSPDEVDELSSVLAGALADDPEALFPDLARAVLEAGWRKAEVAP